MIDFFANHDAYASPSSYLKVVVIDSANVANGDPIGQVAVQELGSNDISVYKS